MDRLACLLVALPLLAGQVSAGDLRHMEDATLRSVFFIDPQEGWVVGDAGVILHTLNGGKTWEQQKIGMPSQRVSLRSVHFLTPRVGWVVGRQELPYGGATAGIVLFTNDGGLEWKQQLANTLPGINQVRFIDLKTGYLLGDGSDRYPSGLFRTTDSGKSWEPVPGARTTSWLTGDFSDAKTGIMAGAWSRMGTLHDGKCTAKDFSANLDGRDVTGLQILARKALAVGQGGLILSSQTGGSAWNPEKKWPTEVLANLDFHAIGAVKDQVWIAGRPGSVIMHSGDAGTTWKLHKTGQALPLHGIFFFDEKRGWAVGDAGTILHSADGGETWTVRHQAAVRVAGMCIHAQNQDAPVDTLSILGAAQSYLMTSLRITAPDSASIASGRARDARRYAAAARQAGALTGETLWHFPLPQHLEGCDKKTILTHWNQLHANDAEKELIRQLVLALRIWRPSVLLSPHPGSKVPVSALLGEAVQEAVKRAADPREFPEQIDELGLQAWQVSKVFGVGAETATALTQDNDEPNLRLQATPRDFAAMACALLADEYTLLPKQRTYERIMPRGEKSGTDRHWMEGLEPKVGQTKREVDLNEKMDEGLMQSILHQRGTIALGENPGDPARTLALVPIMLDKLPDEQAAPAAFAIASRFAQRGQWYLAQEVYLYMVDRYPHHPLSAEAYRWLIRLNTSSEARRRHELKQFAIAQPLGVANKSAELLRIESNTIQQASRVEPGAKQKPPVQRADPRDWNKGSLELMRRLGAFGPVHAFDPATQFCIQSARRQVGEAGASRVWLSEFCAHNPNGPWHEAASAELWLAGQGAQPGRLGRCRYTELRPYLDGKFDDPCWKDHQPMVLGNAIGDTTKDHLTEAMLSYDQEFLYVALKCKHPAGGRVAPVKKRTPDADLDSFDRVSILLDLDRDYATYFHLEVDQRGCVRDSCCGDRSWNPRWFVAVHSTEDCWQIEAAIPLGELTGQRIAQNGAWAFNVVRILPGRGVQSWSQPADVRPCPEGMSLLLFQAGKGKAMPRVP